MITSLCRGSCRGGQRDDAPNVCGVINVLLPYCENVFSSIERTKTGGKNGRWRGEGTKVALCTQNGVKRK